MADTGGKRYGDGCAGGERGGATTARAVCAEVLSVVHGIAVGNPRAGNRTPRAEALAIGRPEGLLAIGLLGDEAMANADLLKLLTQEIISCVFGLKYHKIFLISHKVLGRLI